MFDVHALHKVQITELDRNDFWNVFETCKTEQEAQANMFSNLM